MLILRGRLAKMPHSKERNQCVSRIKAVSTKMEHKTAKNMLSLDCFIHSFSVYLLSTCQDADEERKATNPLHGPSK